MRVREILCRLILWVSRRSGHTYSFDNSHNHNSAVLFIFHLLRRYDHVVITVKVVQVYNFTIVTILLTMKVRYERVAGRGLINSSQAQML